jgi:hypothetical protein
VDCEIEIKGVVVIDDSKLEDEVEGWVNGNVVYNTISGSHVMLRMLGDVHRFVGEVAIRPSNPDG